MRTFVTLTAVLSLGVLAGCESETAVPAVPRGLRVVNAFTSPVDVLIDNQVAIAGLAPGAIETTQPTSGAHTVQFQQSGGTSATIQVTTAKGAMPSIAAIRGTGGAIASVALDDTNAIVAAGKTKVRVLHLAPNAGQIYVYRTQPDFQTPTEWQSPFTYQTDLSSLSAPFLESTPGTWEVRAWQLPPGPSGWASATARISIPLASGEKKTVVVLDKTGAGIRLEIF